MFVGFSGSETENFLFCSFSAAMGSQINFRMYLQTLSKHRNRNKTLFPTLSRFHFSKNLETTTQVILAKMKTKKKKITKEKHRTRKLYE